MKQHPTEEMRRLSNILTESKIVESTLSKLIGNDPGGQNLVKWLHTHQKLSNTADFSEVTGKKGFSDRVAWQLFKANPDNFVIVSGTNAVVAIKPENYDPDVDRSRDGTLVYHVAGFDKGGNRIDSTLIPEPTKDSYKKGKGAGEKFDKAAYEKDYAKWKSTQGKQIPADAPLTKIETTRGGMPFRNDPRGRHNIFDTMKDQLGNIEGVFTSTSHVSGMNKKDVKGYVDKYEPGKVPKSDISDKFADPSSGERKGTGVERDKISSRNADNTISLSQELIKAGKKMRPIFRKVGRPIIVRLQKSASRYKTKGDNAKYAEFKEAERFVKDVIAAAEDPDRLAEFGSLSHPGGKVLGNALLKAAGLSNAEDEDFKEYLHLLNTQGNATDLKQAVDVIKSELQTYAKEG